MPVAGTTLTSLRPLIQGKRVRRPATRALP
jgi:hypothetical protein